MAEYRGRDQRSFPLPSWQQNIGVPPSANDNHISRGIPDVAGNSDPASGYLITANGGQIAIGGTSAFSPLYAGLIALTNSILTNPAGYLNPVLYKYGITPSMQVFQDINDGVSNASDGAPGYTSGPGWDACTGWGRLNGAKLLSALSGQHAIEKKIPNARQAFIYPARVPQKGSSDHRSGFEESSMVKITGGTAVPPSNAKDIPKEPLSVRFAREEKQ